MNKNLANEINLAEIHLHMCIELRNHFKNMLLPLEIFCLV